MENERGGGFDQITDLLIFLSDVTNPCNSEYNPKFDEFNDYKLGENDRDIVFEEIPIRLFEEYLDLEEYDIKWLNANTQSYCGWATIEDDLVTLGSM